MAINNLNPRRTVWFSPHEPSNKYDIWLSKNAHYDENGEPTTDSDAQRDCDYIFKIYDCGKWNPIVGFNSTAKYKINVVNGVEYTYTVPNTLISQTNTGFQQNHLPLFRNPEDSPNELFDAGTLGEALYGFVSGQDWNTLFNSNWFQSAFNTSIIGGSNYIWNTLINSNIDFATITRCGGILSATHPAASSAFKPIEVKFYPEVQDYYQNEQHRLCVSASDVIDQINSYYNDNPSGSSININWNSTTIHQLAEVLYNIFKNSASLGFDDTWSLASDPHVYPHIWGVSSSNAGKFLRINPQWNDEGNGWSQSNNNMDWVDIQAGEGVTIDITGSTMTISADTGTEYSAGTGITISQQNEISIDTAGASTNQVLTKTANGVGWSTPSQQIQYTGTNLIKVNSSNNEIGINMDSNPSSGDIIICDSGIAKWGAVPNPTFGRTQISSGGFVTINGLRISTTTSFTINGQSYQDTDYDLNTWNYYTLENAKAITITNTQTNPEPLYIRVMSAPATQAFSCAGDIIDAQNVLSNTYEKDILITMQFGIAKFEEINTQSSTPVIDNQN